MDLRGPKDYVYKVGASTYGGPSDRKSEEGEHLPPGSDGYAELGMGTLLGGLKAGQLLDIQYNGKEVEVPKASVGLGGAPVHGRPRAIDIRYETAQKLGFPGLDTVYVSRPDGKSMGPLMEPLRVRSVDQQGGFSILGVDTGVPLTHGIASDIATGAQDAANAVVAVPKFLGMITNRTNLINGGKILVGGVMLILGLIELGKVGFGVDVTKAIKL